MLRARRIGLGLAGASLLAACGVAPTTTAAEQPTATVAPEPGQTIPPDPVESAPEESDTPSPEAAGRTVTFSFEDSKGWTYAGEFRIPQVTIVLSKDISASAPGTAQVNADLTVSDFEPQTFSVTNVGRPNGPKVTPTFYAVLKIPASLAEGQGDVVPGGFGGADDACHLGGNIGSFPPNYEPYEAQIECSVGAGGAGRLGSGGQSNVGSERAIDREIKAVNGGTPTFVLNFDAIGRACNIFIFPNGRVVRSDAFAGGCAEKKLKVSVK